MDKEENKNPDDQENENDANASAENAEDNVVNMEATKELSLEEQITALQEQLLEARDRTMRALADSENTRKRAMKDRDDAGKYAVASFARDLLAFGDNFRRALESLPEDTPQAVSEGLLAMDKELSSVYDRHGIKKSSRWTNLSTPIFTKLCSRSPHRENRPAQSFRLSKQAMF